MARATTRTLIPLDTAAKILGINPLHFNGIVTDRQPPETACDDIWFQHTWQYAEKMGREEFADILNQAEQTAAKYLGYLPVPDWIVEEEHELAGSYRMEEYNYRNSNGLPKSVFAHWGYVVAPGIKVQTLIESGVAVVYSDPDGDGYNELATVTVVTTVTDIEEIAVFFPGTSGDYTYEIRPVDVSIAGGTATITFPKYLVPLLSLVEKLPAPDDPVLQIDGDDDSNFVSTVDVYRVYNSNTQQVLLYSEPTDCANGCGQVEYDGCLYVRNSRLGILAYQPATYDDDTEAWTSCYTCTAKYTRARIYYRAGMKNTSSRYPHLRMKPDLARLICYYALTLVDKTICGCDPFTSQLAYQTEDLALISDKRSYMTTPELLNCPLGTKRAAVELWRYILNNQLTDATRKGY